MGRYVMKIDKETDHYVIWSTGTDCPVFDGTRAEIEQYEIQREMDLIRKGLAEDFERLDETGTTIRHQYGGPPLTGSWEDEELSVVNCPFEDVPENWKPGTLQRKDLKRWLDTEDNSLIVPRPDWGDE